jgi:hypothetical protein
MSGDDNLSAFLKGFGFDEEEMRINREIEKLGFHR